MIDRCGWYATRLGLLVKITRILESQPIAEGTLHDDGKLSDHVWNLDGSFNKHRDTDLDIVEFKWEDSHYWGEHSKNDYDSD
jgi:hypothetical protein